ncbi:DUF7288 family protein [Methanocella conradii]|uniref:DUF7288 family protein n=1 Tax=Methanocella conradii TaxID=1175444 RepID=UPI00157C6585|nr:hypothetical protein [Methanocella conradii]
MHFPEGDKGQIYTMEGIVASVILLSVLLFIIQANSIVTPQTERSVDMKLYERASDTLTCMDRNDADSTIWSTIGSLKSYVAGWNGSTVTDGVQGNMTELDSVIRSMLPEHVQYSVSFIYYNGTYNGMPGNRQECPVIVHGKPADNSVVSSRLVTLNEGDAVSDYWKNVNKCFPQVVEVKLTCWYL